MRQSDSLSGSLLSAIIGAIGSGSSGDTGSSSILGALTGSSAG